VVAQVTSATVLPASGAGEEPRVVLGSLLVNSVRKLPLDRHESSGFHHD
jgi:hypothetical protein